MNSWLYVICAWLSWPCGSLANHADDSHTEAYVHKLQYTVTSTKYHIYITDSSTPEPHCSCLVTRTVDAGAWSCSCIGHQKHFIPFFTTFGYCMNLAYVTRVTSGYGIQIWILFTEFNTPWATKFGFRFCVSARAVLYVSTHQSTTTYTSSNDTYV